MRMDPLHASNMILSDPCPGRSSYFENQNNDEKGGLAECSPRPSICLSLARL